ncbi:protein DpdG [Candidatus Uabimicrobium amorphum]|uniref:Uncharacterized protein n=1 Tax=Uabimicrobium amorphum TaxID=2596890 RepID=A0A5S9F6F0_UABAM|nr:protein DpdG [Candidatus Uabimicrobium amorphum]BBM87123.1 hypothetical protein UABAM_05526 [Candidatus Uabimicrobium amorphum]
MKIYKQPEPVPSRMLAVIKLLKISSPLPKNEIVALLYPTAQTQDKTPIQVTRTLSACEECGLVEKDGILYKLSDELCQDTDNIDKTFPITMASRALSPEVGGTTNLFAQICAWILAQPVLELPQSYDEFKNTFNKQGFDISDFGLRNDQRWDMIIYWMKYLGLIKKIKDEGIKGVFLDPTLFFTRHIDKLVNRDEEVTAHKFRKRLGKLCPVLDGGEVRKTVLNNMENEWPDDKLCEATSFGLERLKLQKKIEYWCPDDQRKFLRTSFGEKIAFVKLGKV